MLDLYDELVSVVTRLNESQIQYALCGGLAMAVHGRARATVDVDLLVRVEAYDALKQAVANAGYTFEARPMQFRSGLEIRRLTKADAASGDHVMLDLLLVYPGIEDVWEQRKRIDWNGISLSVVDKPGLIKLKDQRGTGQDLDDIAWLTSTKNSST